MTEAGGSAAEIVKLILGVDKSLAALRVCPDPKEAVVCHCAGIFCAYN